MLVPLHGLGGAQDLPLPRALTIAAAGAALVVSFCVLALAWRTPRFEPVRHERAVPQPLARVLDSPAWSWSLRILGLVFFGYVAWALIFGPDLVTNPALGVFYVWVWVGLVPVSLLFGRIVRALNPIRTLHLLLSRLTGGDPRHGLLDYPASLGYWPAAVGLFAFTWQELVEPDSTSLTSVRLWLAAYAALMLIGGLVFGSVWFARADPFEVYGSLIAKLSPWARHDGRLVWRSPLANLATTVPRPGLVAVVAVLLGSTAFDSFRDSLTWARAAGGAQDPVLIGTLALLGFCLFVGVTFIVAAWSTGVEPGGVPRRELPPRLAHSVVPIIVGYMVAHYLSLLVEYGQEVLIHLSDPMVSGANLIGTGGWEVNYWLSLHPALLAGIKAGAVVLGHIAGVVAAHDRALTLLPKRHQVLGQLGMLVVMLGYTTGGLYLLFSS